MFRFFRAMCRLSRLSSCFIKLSAFITSSICLPGFKITNYKIKAEPEPRILLLFMYLFYSKTPADSMFRIPLSGAILRICGFFLFKSGYFCKKKAAYYSCSFSFLIICFYTIPNYRIYALSLLVNSRLLVDSSIY